MFAKRWMQSSQSDHGIAERRSDASRLDTITINSKAMSIQEIMNAGNSNIQLVINACDLREFAMNLIDEAERMKAKPEDDHQDNDPILSADEAASYLKVSKGTLWRWEKRDILKPIKIGRKNGYHMSEIQRFMNGGSAYEE